MWHCLRRRSLGFKFRRQHPLDRYVLDFYCPEVKLAIELDGGQHAADDERARDAERTTYLESRGIKVLRFWNTDVLINTEGVLESIWRELLTLSETRKPPT
ncbi:MAG: endonuclease domain-containing protein [Planctomycetota bacterium]